VEELARVERPAHRALRDLHDLRVFDAYRG
jgi:hypothetical protein